MSTPFDNGDGAAKYEQLLRDEQQLLRARRTKAGVPHWPETVGVALSGGGIRSATFCLGVLQAISEKGLVPRIDYLSTVSGGSYLGGFFGALFVPDRYRAKVSPAPPRLPFDPAKPLQSKLGLEAVRRLRDAGRYLTPSGTSDAFYGAAVVMRNWAAVQTVIGLTVLLFFWLIRVLDGAITGNPTTQAHSYSLIIGGLALFSSTLVFGFGSSYWLTRRDWIPVSRSARVYKNLFFWMVLAIDGFCFWQSLYMEPVWSTDPHWSAYIFVYTAGFLFISMLAYFCAESRWGKVQAPLGGSPSTVDFQFLVAAEDQVRAKLGDWMSTSLIWLLTFSGIFALDWLGYWLSYAFRLIPQEIASLSLGGTFVSTITSLAKAASPIIVAAAPLLLSYFARQGLRRRQAEKTAQAEGTKVSDNTAAMLVIAGSVVVALWLILWSAASHSVVDGLPPLSAKALLILVALVAINIGQSLCFSFINLSSLSTFYAARLRRAYLGASSYGNPFTNVRQDDPEDTIRVEDYYKAVSEVGAPLHIVNVTVAETIAGTSNLVARDRKGKPMQLSPCGIVYEGDEPGLFKAGKTLEGEQLPLANWIAISGAAVSAAIGSGTTLGTSILATMANVRLGYWWKARHAEQAKDLMWADPKDTVQNYLFLELRGAFDGTRRDRWYLTDGGHFENTGIYSLLQRNVSFIIACDNGADPSYDMVDVLRLIQRARIDLEAEISFLSATALEQKLGQGSQLTGLIGTFAELAKRGDKSTPGGPIAALAEINYRKTGAVGTLLLLKPRLTFTEPPELLGYHAQAGGRDFPQQTTGDQFFDEEQWEAYRRLGEYCAQRLFVEPAAGSTGWLPFNMKSQ